MHFRGPRADHDPVHIARIPDHNTTRGTQDVNDPEAAVAAHRRTGGGVVHVLGSASDAVGTSIRGGIERRPICRRWDARKPLQAEGVVSEAALR